MLFLHCICAVDSVYSPAKEAATVTITKYCLFILSLLFLAVPGARAVEEIQCEKIKAILAEGDLLFQRLADPFGVVAKIAELNDTWVNHLGVAMKASDGRWIVRESSFPKSKNAEICDFVDNSTGNNLFAIRRWKERAFNAQELALLNQEMDARMGQPYDLRFDMNKEKYQFCSKFVYQVFQKIGIEVGKIQTLEEIFKEAPARNAQNMDFWKHWFGGSIPWQQITVTPYSQYVDEDFVTIYDTSLN